MKKILFTAALVAVTTTATLAHANARSNTGCGLGTMLWEGKANNSAVFQSFQATTNGTFGAQTFGITSGTSECQKPANFVQNEKLIHFVQANMDSLAQDIAAGKGETLDTFAELLGVQPSQNAAFNAKLQANFNKIFTSEQVALADVIDNSITVSQN